MKKPTHASYGSNHYCKAPHSMSLPKNTILFLLLFLTSLNFTKAESVLNIAPTSDDAAALYIGAENVTNNLGVIQGNFGSFAYVDSPSKLFFNVQDPSSELVYFGFSQPVTSRTLETGFVEDVRFRILDPSGNPITCWGPNDQTGSAGSGWQNLDAAFANLASGLSGYDQVKIGSYTPFVLDFSSLTCGNLVSGDYSIEFFQDSHDPSSGFYIENFEISVEDANGPIDGRVWSNNWAIGIKQDDLGGQDAEFGRAFNGAFYVCDNDNFVTRIDFDSGDPLTGFRGGTFNVFFNSFGTENTGNLLADRVSKPFDVIQDPSNRFEYKVFLDNPDPAICPEPAIGSFEVITPLLTRCSEEDYCFNISTDIVGQIEVLIDIDGNGIYDDGEIILIETVESTDLVSSPSNANFPYEICVPWDGKDGFGNLVASNSLSVTVFFRQGIFHFPVYDVEYNDVGFQIDVVQPICGANCDLNLFYDDSLIDVDNSLSPQVELNGCGSPCHSWSDNGAPNFGNRNTINTWWYANTTSETAVVDGLSDYIDCTISGPTAICEGETADFSVDCINTPSGTAPALVLTYNWEGPGGFSSTASSTGAISDAGMYSVTISAEDTGCSYVLSKELTLTDPTECCQLEITFPDSNGGTFLRLEDIPDADETIFTVVSSCEIIVEYSFIETTTGGGCPGDPLVLTRTWLIVDSDNDLNTPDESINFEQYFVVEDTEAPLIIACPVPQVIGCENSSDPFLNPILGVPEGSDNSGLDLILTFVDEEFLFGCSLNKQITRTWTVSDQCGNTSSCIQIINQYDQIPHMVTCMPDLVLACGESLPAPLTSFAAFEAAGGSVVDNCSTFFNLGSQPDQQVAGMETACTSDDVYQRLYFVIDECGQPVPCSQQISYEAVVGGPVLSGNADDALVSCTNIPAPEIFTATDACTGNAIDVVFTETTLEGACPQSYVITRTWSATDDCGEVASVEQIITVEDLEAPVFANVPQDMTVECADLPEAAIVTAVDGCDANVEVTFVEETTDQCPASYTLVRTWTATDNCGNSVVISQAIECIDSNPDPSVCDDGDCNTLDEVNYETCSCDHTVIEAPSCDDGNDCTEDIYDPSTCTCMNVDIPCGGNTYCTYTIGYWGNHPAYLASLLDGNNLTVGNYELTLSCLDFVLPGPPKHKQQDTHCGVEHENSVSILRQTIALKLNLLANADEAQSDTEVGNLANLLLEDILLCGTNDPLQYYIDNYPGITVQGLIDLADTAIAAENNDTQLNEALDAINIRYDECQTNNDCSGARSGNYEKESLSNVLLSPNPVTTHFKIILFEDNYAEQNVEIYNSNGQLVYSKMYTLFEGKNNVRVDTRDWNAGIYYVLIQGKTGSVQHGNFVKIRD